MATYLGAMHGTTILTAGNSAGKKVDMAYIYAQKPTPICIRSGWMANDDETELSKEFDQDKNHHIDDEFLFLFQSRAAEHGKNRLIMEKY